MPEIYPIGGGKGGVGKSFVAASLAALIAKHGKTAVLVDLDLGAANLHTLLGMKNPPNGLGRFLDKKAQTLASVASPTHLANLSLISSAQCSVEIANLYYTQKTKLIKAIRRLPYDYILLDLGAGSNFNTIDFFIAANGGVVVCTVEPTAIENTFRFIKSIYIRRLKQIIKRHTFNDKVKDAVFANGNGALRSRDIMDIVRQYHPGKEPVLKEMIGKFEFKLLINQLRNNADPDLGEKIKAVCNQHFYSTFTFLGNIHFDERVYDSVLTKRLFIERYAETATAVELNNVARLLTNNSPFAFQRGMP